MAAHCLARYRFRGNRVVRYRHPARGMILPPQLLILSLFQILLEYGLYNSPAGPDARLCRDPAGDDRLHPRRLLRPDPAGPVRRGADGRLRDFEIFWRIALPIGMPAIFTTVILNFIILWNEFLLRRRAADRRRQAHAAARHHAFHGRPSSSTSA